MIFLLFTVFFTHLIQSVKKWGLSACTMTTSKKSLQFFPTMWVIPLSLHAGKTKRIMTEQFTPGVCQSGQRQRQKHLHKSEGAVGDQEEFLSMTNQLMQDSLGLFSSQDELIYEEKVDSVLFYTKQRADLTQKEEEFSYRDLPSPICTCIPWGEPCQSLPED